LAARGDRHQCVRDFCGYGARAAHVFALVACGALERGDFDSSFHMWRYALENDTI
jgi:hypothetical protein